MTLRRSLVCVSVARCKEDGGMLVVFEVPVYSFFETFCKP